ncbi:hypothetical protein [Flavobacterium chungangensis]|uniref:Uncharacterized protein n=1 Tax=Flavobacterium chungangensis TaxID=2708132 RepID=A0ABV8ZFT0_9FLAO
MIPIDINKILLANSPIYASIVGDFTDYNYIYVQLWAWNGKIEDKPVDSTFKLAGIQANADNSKIAIEISDYITPFLEPKPNSTFFSLNPSGFGEFVNVEYFIEGYFLDDSGNMDLVRVYNSGHLFACLGYGYVNELVHPKLKLEDGKLIDNTKKISTDEVIHHNVVLKSSVDSDEIINREFTSIFRKICAKDYTSRQVLFLDKNGLINSFTFPRVSSKKAKYTAEKYNITNTAGSYSTSGIYNKIYNKNGQIEWTFNTDNLDEYNVNLIQQLFTSDRHWLVDYQRNSFIPIHLVDDNFEKKTAIKDRAKMNYTIKFIEANDFIQNIR